MRGVVTLCLHPTRSSGVMICGGNGEKPNVSHETFGGNHSSYGIDVSLALRLFDLGNVDENIGVDTVVKVRVDPEIHKGDAALLTELAVLFI